MSRTFCAFAILAMLSLSPQALADSYILLKNGDRITGDISKIWDGEVFIEPSYADEFAVDLDEVEHIDSDEIFEFALVDSTEIVGQLTLAPGGDQVLSSENGTRRVEVDAIDIAEEPLLGREFEAATDVAMNVSSGNAETASFYGGASFLARFGRHRNSGRLAIDRQEDSGTPIKDQFDVGYRYNWLLRDDWFLEAGGAFRADPVRDLDRRILVGGGLGKDLIRQSWRQLRVVAGPTYVSERIGGEDEESVAMSWSHSYERKLFHGDAEFFHRMQILSYVAGRENNVVDTSTGFNFDFWDDFYVRFQLDVNYETDPSPGNENEDISYKIGFGYEY